MPRFTKPPAEAPTRITLRPCGPKPGWINPDVFTSATGPPLTCNFCLRCVPGYLSTVVRTCTGRIASEWIERHVAQEAKALLKSTNMTVQQISNELNFPSQSFFGKFFKRLTGLSPKEYRRS